MKYPLRSQDAPVPGRGATDDISVRRVSASALTWNAAWHKLSVSSGHASLSASPNPPPPPPPPPPMLECFGATGKV
ncbi:hypothetical protein JZ751_010050 [Albula glossodonta]|uniref:Uncharacterized protein n=1 Tax=Albula glossodonta TaxID=121402 RepID=A0A8T2N162_9TELE|nr:hypothetical protein JZ751_010050 [Albula glossodonta]